MWGGGGGGLITTAFQMAPASLASFNSSFVKLNSNERQNLKEREIDPEEVVEIT